MPHSFAGDGIGDTSDLSEPINAEKVRILLGVGFRRKWEGSSLHPAIARKHARCASVIYELTLPLMRLHVAAILF